ncbi:putative DNA binding domain-containing protein [Sphingobacterium multivorum]|uniref:ATP-binding protein n=1 Tax=Sphingobacterium multivorum TaxID=28454 RepID=UPI001919B4FA|nr:ATP-binding protein [Sphingobacterium multivorum]QQT60307.1 putative DNA binding domain-containing protein [Sphingobacterium multivorum]
MPEQQNIEYKESWHDEYLKWVCGFANAQGGVIYIGKDDNGDIVGLEGYKKLMDDIPNKIRNAMGITVEVNLHEEAGEYFIEIVTHPYSVPISLRGRYYYRSGSTKQELTGASLNEFLLKKSGKTWDDVIEPRATFDDIDETAVAKFLVMAKEKGRLPEVDGLSTEQLFDKLRLTESGQLKRAALVLFGKDPVKFYPSINVRIGRFRDELDLVFQESEENNIINLYQTVLNQINHKFIVKNITFEGMHRIETPEYPREAMREAILNALVHRNYMGAHTQIRVYDDKITFWNEGGLQSPLTIESLKRPHSSRPRNVLIADVCFKGGLIDAWGRGTIKIIEACKQAGLPEPEIIERDGGLLVTLFKNSMTTEQLVKLGLNERQLKAVEYVKERGKITNKEYQEINLVAKPTATRDLSELVEYGIFRNTGKGAGSYYEIIGS